MLSLYLYFIILLIAFEFRKVVISERFGGRFLLLWVLTVRVFVVLLFLGRDIGYFLGNLFTPFIQTLLLLFAYPHISSLALVYYRVKEGYLLSFVSASVDSVLLVSAFELWMRDNYGLRYMFDVFLIAGYIIFAVTVSFREYRLMSVNETPEETTEPLDVPQDFLEAIAE
ncbi:MAG: hypothetical protein NWE89_14195 [Candidatus Bathyarchaeota archaeon]|nr:hypothetical protein [Candidatus Bathyarchaeota archaeon]